MHQKKICLIKPPSVECFRFAGSTIMPPLGLAYIAGALQAAGHQVTVIDSVTSSPDTMTRYYKGYLIGLPLAEVAARIPLETAIVGITVVFTHEWPEIVHLIDLIKQRRPDLTVIIGGEHATAMAEFCLSTSKADIVVLGEGEETIVELVDALETGRSLTEIDGLAFHDRDHEQIIVNKRRMRMTEIDSLTPPAWDMFDLKTYHDRRYEGCMHSASLSVPILATRGCPYQCTYCSSANMWTLRWIPRDPIKVVDEIEGYMRKYGAGNFPLQDLTAIIKKDWIVTFCKEILRRQLKIVWQLPVGTRVESVDDEVAILLHESGMINMAYAPESGSEMTRKLIKKKMRTDSFFDSLRAAVGAKLNVMCYVVLGFPHDTREHIMENMKFVDQMVAEGMTDVSVGFFMALPGSEMFYSLYDAGKIKIGRAYFCHMLHSLALWPAQSYTENLSCFDLAMLKMRILLRFYGARRSPTERAPLFFAILRALSGLFGSGSHNSKLQTAFRNGVKSAYDSIRARFKPAWLPRQEEARMFENWEAIYRELRRTKLADGLIQQLPADTSKLHLSNYVPMLQADHRNARSFNLPSM
ncbi:MAG TPA: radical SAM protein [Rhodocyclaceae bacterium]|nr:radical SAM protein [Rhodocyclaceae bacterium]